MSGCCGQSKTFDGASEAYRRTLWIIASLNAVMFVVEMTAGAAGESLSLQADALDFLGDAATYAISLWAIGQALPVRAKAALIKGASMAALGLWVLGATVYRVFVLNEPSAVMMGGVATVALCVNLFSALLLMRFRDGDANVRSVWLCTRNDVIGNAIVVAAAAGVFASGTRWPDLAVAGIMAALFLHSSREVIRGALAELADSSRPPRDQTIREDLAGPTRRQPPKRDRSCLAEWRNTHKSPL